MMTKKERIKAYQMAALAVNDVIRHGVTYEAAYKSLCEQWRHEGQVVTDHAKSIFMETIEPDRVIVRMYQALGSDLL